MVSDNTGMVVALPTMASEFGASMPVIQWVVVGYSLAITVLLLPMGRLGDIIGRKQVYISGFCIFIVAGFAAGLAPSVELLIVFKIGQGIGSAMTQGTAMAMVISAFPKEERGKALGVQMSLVGVGGIAGPAFAGFLIASFGWPSVLYTTSSMGILAAITGIFLLNKPPRIQESYHFDWLGAGLSAFTLIGFHSALLVGPLFGWSSIPLITSLAFFTICIGIFIFWESNTQTPMISLELFKDRIFVGSAVARYASFLAMSSVRYLMPFYLQWILGIATRNVGLILVPSAICMILVGPLSGRMADSYGWKKLCLIGLTIMLFGLGLGSQLGLSSNISIPIMVMILLGLGLGVFNPANGSAILSRADPGNYGVVSSFTNLMRNSGNVTGITVATAIVTTRMTHLGYDSGLTGPNSLIDDGTARIAFLSGLELSSLAVGLTVLLGFLLISVFTSTPATSSR